MFDQVPVRAWLLLLIAVFAFPAVQYLYRHLKHSPSRRDITQAAEDVSWRTTRRLAWSLSTLVGLLGLSVFIFTPAAEQFAASPRFWPILSAVFGAGVLSTVPLGVIRGRVQPLIRGLDGVYERESHPYRFWGSLAWNAALGSMLMWVAYQANEDASGQAAFEECAYDKGGVLSRKLAACDELIQLRPNEPDGYMERGLIFLAVGALDPAAADLTRAHQLNPEDPWPLANRGLVWAWKKDRSRAEEDFKKVRAVDPDNPVMLRGQALLKRNAGDMRGQSSASAHQCLGSQTTCGRCALALSCTGTLVSMRSRWRMTAEWSSFKLNSARGSIDGRASGKTR